MDLLERSILMLKNQAITSELGHATMLVDHLSNLQTLFFFIPSDKVEMGPSFSASTIVPLLLILIKPLLLQQGR